MTWSALRRIVEAFFRRWPFYVLLLIGALAFGFLSVSRSVEEYSATGSVFVDSESLVTTQSGVQDGGFFSFLTPAQFTSQELNGLISTESFMEEVVGRAGVELDTAPGLRVSQIDGLRRSITSFATSENLVAVSVTTFDPELSFRLVNGVIEEFVQFQINIDIAESGASEEFFSELVEGYRQDLVDTRDAVDATLRGVADLEELNPDQALELERLQAAEALASERFRAALQNVEASRLATLQTETDVRQSYSVFDPPAIPTDPNGSLLDDLILLAVFGLAGLVLAMIGPIASAILNRTVQFAEDLEATTGVPVVTVLPAIGSKQLRLEGAIATSGAGDWGASGEALGRRTITFLPEEPDEAAVGAEAEAEPAIAEADAPATKPPKAPKAAKAATPQPPAPAAAPVAASDATSEAATTPTAPAPPGAPTAPDAPGSSAKPVEPAASAKAEPAAPTAPAGRVAETSTETPKDDDALDATKTATWPSQPQPPSPGNISTANTGGSKRSTPQDDELGEGVRAVGTDDSTSKDSTSKDPGGDGSDDSDDAGATDTPDTDETQDLTGPLREILANTQISGQVPPAEPPPPPGSKPPTNGKPTRQSRV